MLIEKEKIQQAKEKLGEQNAFIIAEELKLEDFDTKNHKACCCYHLENTPSFIYNPKTYGFHCFGCGKNVDIIDAFMQNGLTYIESVQRLFELANIKHSFGELKVKTKRQYKYPREVICFNKDKVYTYLSQRKISKETVDYTDTRQDENGNIVFNFYDTNDVLTTVKYRPSHKVVKPEIKTWAQKDADTTPVLFNMNRVNINNPLLITEGEIDCLSSIEAGYINAVSVPFGATNYSWIEENWDWLQQFDQIIICSDNDEAGLKMQKETIFRLGSWRTKIVEIPQYFEKPDGTQIAVNDLNEVLYWFGKEKVLDIIVNAKDSPVDSVIDFSDIKEVDLDEIDGIYTGIDELDRELMRLFYGTFTILTGINGSGKSSFLSQLICESLDQGKDAWLYSKELPNYMSKNWINYILAGRRHIKEYSGRNDSVYYKVTNEAKEAIDNHYKGKLYIYKDGWSNTIDDIKQSMEDSARKFGSKLFIVDNLTAINLKNNDENKWDKQAEFVSYLIDFAQRFHVVVILVIHPKKIETMRRLTKVDIQGSGSMLDLAHRSLSLYRVTKTDKKGVKNQKGNGWYKEPIPFDVLVDVLKDRLRGREGLTCGLYYDIPSRRFFTNPKEFNRQYSWDKSKYENELPYPIRDEANEIYGEIKNG